MTRPITIALLAMGGEGGGVVADWLVDLAEQAGWIAQSTSVPGVAQRTGATIYYIELFPGPVQAGRQPVLALMPVPGEVDLVVASELMEAGRAVQRGLVTADRTTMVASAHRVYATLEKIAMGDGRVDSQTLFEGCRAAARTLLHADFAQLSEQSGSPIGPALFGGIAASGCLPFGRDAFEAAIRRGGVGVAASLRAFALGFDAARASVQVAQVVAEAAGQAVGTAVVAASQPTQRPTQGPSQGPSQALQSPALGPRLAPLAEQVRRDFPASAQATLLHGLLRLADCQDVEYAAEYLQRLAPFGAVATTRALPANACSRP
jgi:indolepyruvate ferredoxin oxidoreductase beta subunit